MNTRCPHCLGPATTRDPEAGEIFCLTCGTTTEPRDHATIARLRDEAGRPRRQGRGPKVTS